LLKGFISQEGRPVLSEELRRLQDTVRYLGKVIDSVGVFTAYSSERFVVMLIA